MDCAGQMRSLLAVLLVASTLRASPAWAQWPQANGPRGNFTPSKPVAALLDDAAQAKQTWLSEDDDLGYAKGSVSGYLQNLARWPGHPGSSSGPIVADGKLFVTTFRPSGDAWAENLPQYKQLHSQAKGKPLSDEQRGRLRRNLRIGADDLTVAIDLTNGHTLWKAVEERRGLNRYMGKRQGFCVSPAWHEGVVFSMGTTGLLYAYQADSGKKLWETNIGPAHERALAHREQVLKEKLLPGGMGWDVSLVVAGGVLVVPLFDGTDVGLRGVDVTNGKTLWEVPRACSRHATPAVWSRDNKEYLLTATVSGKLHLIDPADGRTLWTVDGLGPNHFSLTPTARHVFVNGGSNTPRKPGDDEKYGLLAAYSLSPRGATLAWKHPQQPDLFFPTWMDSCARRFLAVADGRVYYRAHGPDKSQKLLLVLDEATGKVLAATDIDSPALQYYPAGDKLLAIRDASHSETELAFIKTDPRDFRQLTGFWSPPHSQTTAYEVYMEHPFVDGRLYLRTKDGRIACYDLRKSDSPVDATGS